MGSFEPAYRSALRGEARMAGLPVYDDITEVTPREGLVVQLTGEVQQPAGIWWYHDGHWFSGDRTRISERAETGGNDTIVIETFRLPPEMELDIWQAQAMNIDGSDSGVFIDVYSPDRDEVLYEYSADNRDGVIEMDNPIDVVGQDSDMLEVRLRNDTGGNVTITAFLIVSLQTIIDQE